MHSSEPFLRTEDVSKRYGATLALDSVDLGVSLGEIHGLVGANGAGKSTLVKILSGAEPSDTGTIHIGNWSGAHTTPRVAQQQGLATIYQEPMLVPQLSIAENVVLGREPAVAGWAVSRRRLLELVEPTLDRAGVRLDPSLAVDEISPAQRQLVEIAKALHHGAQAVLLDEPTAVLGPDESRMLFDILASLKADGVGILYISHHLNEVLEVCDRVTVLRGGRKVMTQAARSATADGLVFAMLGHEVVAPATATSTQRGPEVLSLSGLSQTDRLHDVSLSVHAGEIVGVTGLLGSGRSRLLKTIFGAHPVDSGGMRLRGAPYHPRSPRGAIRQGVGLVPEDRKNEAVLGHLSCANNITLGKIPTSAPGVIASRRENSIARRLMTQLDIQPARPRAHARSLSGGNQQKVSLARWINTGAALLLLDEPGQGIDVGAKDELFQTLREMAAVGCAVLAVSSDLEELVQIADRILVMRQGRIAGELPSHQATEQRVLELSLGLSRGVSAPAGLTVPTTVVASPDGERT